MSVMMLTRTTVLMPMPRVNEDDVLGAICVVSWRQALWRCLKVRWKFSLQCPPTEPWFRSIHREPSRETNGGVMKEGLRVVPLLLLSNRYNKVHMRTRVLTGLQSRSIILLVHASGRGLKMLPGPWGCRVRVGWDAFRMEGGRGDTVGVRSKWRLGPYPACRVHSWVAVVGCFGDDCGETL